MFLGLFVPYRNHKIGGFQIDLDRGFSAQFIAATSSEKYFIIWQQMLRVPHNSQMIINVSNCCYEKSRRNTKKTQYDIPLTPIRPFNTVELNEVRVNL